VEEVEEEVRDQVVALAFQASSFQEEEEEDTSSSCVDDHQEELAPFQEVVEACNEVGVEGKGTSS
jgi:hypothetical protein